MQLNCIGFRRVDITVLGGGFIFECLICYLQMKLLLGAFPSLITLTGIDLGNIWEAAITATQAVAIQRGHFQQSALIHVKFEFHSSQLRLYQPFPSETN